MKVAPLFLMSAAASTVSMWTQGLHLAADNDPQWVRSWPERLVTAGDAVWFYLGKLVWPYPLITIYPRWQIDAGQWLSYLPLLAVISALFILWFKRESWARPWFFVFAYFLVALFPVLGLVGLYFQRYSFVADHFQYLASMGPLALAAAGMVRLADFALPARPWLRSSLCAGLLLILGVLSWQRTWVYESQETLWTDTLARNPDSWAAHDLLGNALFKRGHVDEAIAQIQKAMEIYPNYPDGHYNLGVALAQNGQVDEAIAEYKKALEVNPNDVKTRYNLGNILLQKGQVDEATAQFQKALEINPNFAQVHNSFGGALLLKGQVDEAIAQFQEALEINPNNAEAHYNLGNALLRKGEADEAIAQFQEALRLNPDFSEAQKGLVQAQVMAWQKATQK
jgi:Flp pilus assembly protein TadD